MSITQYDSLLDVDLRYRVRFESKEKRVLHFTVQLEFLYEDNWRPVVRYDTADGYAHRDMVCPRRRKLPMVASNYNEALDLAIDDIKQRGYLYREECEKWLRRIGR